MSSPFAESISTDNSVSKPEKKKKTQQKEKSNISIQSISFPVGEVKWKIKNGKARHATLGLKVNINQPQHHSIALNLIQVKCWSPTQCM